MSKGGRWWGEPQFFHDINDRDRCYACHRHLDEPNALCDQHDDRHSYDWALRHTHNQKDPRSWWQRLVG